MTEREARALKVGDRVKYHDGINEPEYGKIVVVNDDFMTVEFETSSETGFEAGYKWDLWYSLDCDLQNYFHVV